MNDLAVAAAAYYSRVPGTTNPGECKRKKQILKLIWTQKLELGALSQEPGPGTHKCGAASKF